VAPGSAQRGNRLTKEAGTPVMGRARDVSPEMVRYSLGEIEVERKKA